MALSWFSNSSSIQANPHFQKYLDPFRRQTGQLYLNCYQKKFQIRYQSKMTILPEAPKFLHPFDQLSLCPYESTFPTSWWCHRASGPRCAGFWSLVRNSKYLTPAYLRKNENLTWDWKFKNLLVDAFQSFFFCNLLVKLLFARLLNLNPKKVHLVFKWHLKTKGVKTNT